MSSLAHAVAHRREAGDDGGERSNAGGTWRSSNRLFVDEPFRTLAAAIGEFVSGTVARDLGLRRGTQLGMTEMWANVTPPGGRHRIHHHGSAYLSGVYYVTTPPDCGGLVLHDPRDAAAVLGRYWELSDDLSDLTDPAPEVPPAAGDLHVFHAWVRHEVAENRSDAERLSISFNFVVESVPGPPVD